MYDYNFIYPYIVVPKRTNLKRILAISLGTMMLFGVVVYPASLFMNLSSVKSSVKALDMELESIDNIKRVAEVNKVKASIKDLESALEKERFAGLYMSNIDDVNDGMLDKIAEKLVTDMYLQRVELFSGYKLLAGTAKSKDDIAQLEYNLRQDEDIDNVFIAFIEKVEQEDENVEDEFIFELYFYTAKIDLAEELGVTPVED